MRVLARCGAVWACVALSVACGTSSPGLTQLQTIDLANLSGVSGGEEIIAVQWIPFSGGQTLQVYRQDKTNPDRLLLAASLPLSGGYAIAKDVGVSPDWIVVGMTLVALSPSPTVVGQLNLGTDPATAFAIVADHAIARGTFLFVATGSILRLYSLADPAHPALISSFDVSAPVRAVAAVPAGFVAFADERVAGVSNPAQPVWNTRLDARLPFARKAVSSGAQVVIAGQGHIAGRSQVARVDATDPANASIVLSADDLPVEMIDFAWDGSTTYLLFGPGTTTPGYNSSPMLLLQENAGQLRSEGTSQVWPVYGGDRPTMVHAWNGHLYRAEIGMHVYRLP